MSIIPGQDTEATDFDGIKMFKGYAADSQASDTYVITVSPVPASYTAGDTYVFKANTANTGAATLNVNSLGAKTIKKYGNTDLATGDILSGQIVIVVYDGTNFQIQSQNETMKHKHGSVSRGIDTATGTVTVTHNLGVIPKIIRMFAGVSQDMSSGSNTFWHSDGTYIVADATYSCLVQTGREDSAKPVSISTTYLAAAWLTVTVSNITATQIDLTFTYPGATFNNDTAIFQWQVEG